MGGACTAIAAINITSGTLEAGKLWIIGTADILSYLSTSGPFPDVSGSTEYIFLFNGDDALQIRLGGVVMDQFGTCGFDPGSAWSGSGVSTANQNIELNIGITTGDTDGWSDPSSRFSTVSTTPATLPAGLSGFGVAPASAAGPEINITGNSVNIADGDVTPSVADHTDFGSVVTASGTQVRTFTIQNLGTAALSLDSAAAPYVSINGTHAADFTVTAAPSNSIAASGSTTFNITLDPSADGLRSAYVYISNNDGDENPYTFAIQGTGFTPVPEMNITGNSITIADGDATPSLTDHTDFGNVNVASGSISRVFTIANTGSANLILDGSPTLVAISGPAAADFTVTASPASPVAPSGSTTFTVTFDPSALGARNATITIDNSDADEDPYNFAIAGNGIDLILFDDFNRSDNATVGIPSSGGAVAWTEDETGGGCSPASDIIRIANNTLEISNCNEGGGGSCGGNNRKYVSFDMSAQYSTVFNTADSEMSWHFNMKESRDNPSGFGSGNYGIAVVLGATEADLSSATVDGYAVILGESDPSPDPVRLVYFTNGIANYTSLIDIDIDATNDYLSVNVNYDPCTGEWSMQARNDGASSFADPATLSETLYTATNNTYTATNLPYFGAFRKHNSSCEEIARFDNFYIPNTTALTVATYVWDGSEGSDYQEPDNWTPSRDCPRITDILEVNTDAVITNMPTQTIGQLLIGSGAAVSISDVASDAALSVLSIGGNTGTDLDIPTTSSLTLDVASSDNTQDAVQLFLLSGATAEIGGTLIFRNSNASSAGRPHRLDAAASDAITVISDGIIESMDLGDNPFGDTGTADILTFQSGSKYISGDGPNPFGLGSPNSKVTFETGSEYRHEQIAIEPSITGRTYADFTYAAPGAKTQLFGSGTNNTVTIDNFTVETGTWNITYNTNDLPCNFLVSGDFTVAAGAVFNFSPDAVTATSGILFTGAGTHEVTVEGDLTLGSNSRFGVEDGGTVNLNDNIITSGELVLDEGIIVVADVLTIENTDEAAIVADRTGTALTTSDLDAWVIGDLRRAVNSTGTYLYPLGDVVIEMAALDLISSSGISTITGSFHPAILPPPIPIVEVEGTPIEGFLNEGFWTFNPDAITSVQYNLILTSRGHTNAAADADFHGILHRDDATSNWEAPPVHVHPASLVCNTTRADCLAMLADPDNWTMENGGGDDSNNGGIDFPVSVPLAFGGSVLPIELSDFDVVVQNDEVHLSWTTQSELDNDFFVVERSRDGFNWMQIGQVNGSGTSSTAHYYNFIDVTPTLGNNYYRLLQQDTDGKSAYSWIRSAFVGTTATIAVYPNPAADQLIIAASTELTIYDMSGAPVLFIQTDGTPIDISNLPAGIYTARMKAATSYQFTQFIKL